MEARIVSATANTSYIPGTRPAEPLGLAIDTTFDDTSVALLRGKREVLANLTLSQFADHAEFGGVVPERASRRHLEVIHPLLEKAMAKAGGAMGSAPLEYGDLDYVAVSNLPGLLGSILVGMTTAKSLAFLLEIPLIGINHIEAHPYANFLEHGELAFPLLHLVAAGGHTLLIHQRDHFQWEIVGRSVDDAAGECVDKVAKMFGHPMPGGPVVDRLAVAHEPGPYAFPRPMINDPGLNFSFSGLKTAMLYFLREREAEGGGKPGEIGAGDAPGGLPDEGPVLAAFFAAVSDVLIAKTLRAAARLQVPTVTLSGGLGASRKLRKNFSLACAEAGLDFRCPPPALCTDNAAMVGCLAAYKYAAGMFDDLRLEAYPNLPM
jgi:N6-L-threonylcarbamoyladenine synthase